LVVVPDGCVVVVESVLAVTPPAGVVAEPRPLAPLLVVELPPPAFELAPLDEELELELFDAAPDPAFKAKLELAVVDDELLELDPVVVVAVEGVAALVVGMVSVGAPAVSFDPLPLPPQAARTNAASTAAPPARTARY
jgi:hypothetical protein